MPENQMTYQDAYDLLVQNIYAPVFFEKLSNDYGIKPANRQEASELLNLAGKLEQAEQTYVSKQAQDRVGFFSKASNALDTILGRPNYQVNTQNEAEIKEAASALVQNQQIRNAAILYQDCLRQLAGA